MTAAGWYYYEGDAADTTRYWDGNVWVGAPVVGTPQTAGGYDLIPPDVEEPASAQVVAVAQTIPTLRTSSGSTLGAGGVRKARARSELPPGLKGMAIVVAVLKAIPLLIAVGLTWWLTTINETELAELRLERSDELVDNFRDFALVVFVICGVFGALLAAQIFAAATRRPVMLLVVALVLTLLDVASVLGNAVSGGGGALILVIPITIVQFVVLIRAAGVVFARPVASPAAMGGRAAF